MEVAVEVAQLLASYYRTEQDRWRDWAVQRHGWIGWTAGRPGAGLGPGRGVRRTAGTARWRGCCGSWRREPRDPGNVLHNVLNKLQLC